jgi:two-component system sensor histidine kinase TctE
LDIGSMTPAPDLRAGGSIARRLLTLLLVPLGGLLLLALLFDYLVVEGPMRTSFDRQLADAAIAIAGRARVPAEGPASVELPADVARHFAEEQGVEPLYALRTTDGRWLAGDTRLPARPAGVADTIFATLVLAGLGPTRIVWYRTSDGATPLVLAVAQRTAVRDAAVRPLLTATLTLDVLQLVAVIALVLIGVRRGLRPLLDFRDELAARPARDLRPLDADRVPIEVRGLVEALNALLDQVSATAESQRKFVADAAHQLRTPLAGMQAQLELLERDTDALPVHGQVGAVREGLKRLAHTAHQLLTLARAEGSATLERDFVDVDLPTLVAAAVGAQLDRALARRIDLGAETAPAHIRGVYWLLGELVANLLDNALRYTPDGGVVTLRTGALPGGGAFIEVEDDGPGIPVPERPLVVQRFHRVPGTAGEGSGLGLAIVADIVMVHGGRFEIGDGAGGRGARVRVEFRG